MGCSAPVLVNYVISQMVGNQGWVYWMMVINSWMLLVLFAYHWGAVLDAALFIDAVSAMFLLSASLILALRVDLSSHDFAGFPGNSSEVLPLTSVTT